jgi:hypothetical protein
MSKKNQSTITPGGERKLFNLGSLVEVNLPHSSASFESGNGETVWAQLSNRDFSLYNRDVETTAVVALRNDPYLFPDLTYGQELTVRLRAGKKPIAYFDGQLAMQRLNPVAVEQYGLEGEPRFWPSNMLWQFRQLNPDQRLVQLSGADTLGFENVWLEPGLSTASVREYVNHITHHHSCTHHAH